MATFPLAPPAPFRPMTEEEYLTRIRTEDWKADYISGVVYELTGGTWQQSRIGANLIHLAMSALGEKPCEVFTESLSVYVPKTSDYFSPDVSVVCDKPAFRDGRRDLLLNPRVLFEVLSPSTEGRDRGDKFEACQQIDSLQEFVVVSQSKIRIEAFRRAENGFWVYQRLAALHATLNLTSLDIAIPLAAIYKGVEFDQPQ